MGNPLTNFQSGTDPLSRSSTPLSTSAKQVDMMNKK